MRDRAFGVYHYVGVLERPFATPKTQAELTLQRYDTSNPIPGEVLADLLAEARPRAAKILNDELTRGAILWIGRIDGEIAMSQMLRTAEHFQNWYVPLEAGDAVAFRGETRQRFRGRHLRTNFLAWILELEPLPIQRVYNDIRTDNTASLRNTERQGYRRVVTVKRTRDARHFVKDR